jgi:hypothetical protein
MNRYNTPFRFFDEKGKQFYPSFTYPKIQEKLSDIYIIGSYSDRLDNLAWTYYKDPTQIRIPTDIQPIIEEYNLLNSISINN